ncbi:MAG: transcription antitermination factor NusB, partial [Vulcanimicrobiaceae bacterium]
VLRDVFGPQARAAQAAFAYRAERAQLDARDRAFAAELAYGAIKARRLLDWYLEPYLGGRRRALAPAIAEIVRLGAYQLRCMGGIEPHAAVSESVNLAWRHGHRGTAGLVNAVLRKIAAEPPREPEFAAASDRNDALGVRYSLPTWLVAQWASVLGPALEEALRGVNAAPQRAVRTNPLRGDPERARAALEALGVTLVPSTFVDEVFVASADGALGDDPQGRWFVQSEAAAFVADLLAPLPGETVLELCSGRGTKSAQLGARLAGRGQLFCVEADARKLPVLRATLVRAQVEASVVEGDATRALPDLRADAVLVDAPCSATGTIGRHPEARWRKSPQDGARLAPSQDALLEAACRRLRAGGRLVYAVCSIDPREGRERIAALLARRAELAPAALPERYAPFACAGALLVPPGLAGRDGFFIAQLRKS